MPIHSHFNQRTVQGPQGAQGPQGVNGVQGAQGTSASNASAIGVQYLTPATWPATEGTTGSTWVTFPSGPSGVVTTGTSAIVIISATLYFDTGFNHAGISLSINDDMTTATLDARSAIQTPYGAGIQNMLVAPILVTGLTPGSNKFTMVMKKLSASGGTAYFYDRSITVIPY